MDLKNLQESLDSTARQAEPANREMYDERLNSEFRVAALQLTNLYKKGLENAHDAFESGYALALRDILEYVRGKKSQDTAQHVEQYLQARLEALRHHETDECHAAIESRRTHTTAAQAPTSHRIPSTPTNSRPTSVQRSSVKVSSNDTETPRTDMPQLPNDALESTPDTPTHLRPRKRPRGFPRFSVDALIDRN
ncbi:hypothetical protein MYAM1_000084 [Malassezia yamatoensis]|uniref:Uncharacterized protein n=1 Tax=Malassezia yamatoensis TaxID=253288 RepID=A0AAJ5YW16_9BASI|nr:hypothetical protein MYAM1_000084 [Malassezia yamatoensis]